MTSKSDTSLKFGSGSTSRTTPVKNVIRQVEINVDQVQPGLFCVICQWSIPKYRAMPPKNDTMTAGLAQTVKPSFSFEMPIQTPTSTSTAFTFGALECTVSQQQTAQLDEKPQTQSSGTTFASATAEPSNARGFHIPALQLKTSLGSSNTISDKPDAKDEITEYVAEFTIKQQPYTVKASFVKSTSITGSIELRQVKRKPSIATKIDVVSDTKWISGNRILQNNNAQLPSAVWVYLSRSEKKHYSLKCSSSDRCWVSENLIGIFESLGSSVSGIGLWKSLACSIYVQFETINARETKALKQFTNLYVEQIYCDVQFSLRREQQIGGHRSILAARSPVFAAMFRNDMKEATTGQVKMEDCEPDIFEQLLHYIYSGRIPTPLTDAIAQSLFMVADKYDIQDLKEECVDFLLTCVTLGNVVGLLVWSHLHLVEALKEVALTFMTCNGKRVCLLKDWEELAKNYPDLCVLAFRRMMGCAVQRNESVKVSPYELNFTCS